MARTRLPSITWPSWRYGPTGQKGIFECIEDVPFGWTEKPIEEGPGPEDQTLALSKDELIVKLQELNIEINPIWGTAHLKKVLDDSSTAR